MRFYGRLSPGIATSIETPLELVLHLPRKADGIVVKIWERAEFVDIDGKLVTEDGGDDLLLELHGKIEKDPAMRARGRGKFVVEKVVSPPRDPKAKLDTLKIVVEGVEKPYEATIPSTQDEMLGQNFEIAITIEHGGNEVFASKVPTFIRPTLATPRVVGKHVDQYSPDDGTPIFDDEQDPVYLAGHYVTLGKANSETDDGNLVVTGFAMIDESGRLLPCDGDGQPLPGEVVSLRTHKELFAYITDELPKAAKTIGDSSISLRLCYAMEADGTIDYDTPHPSTLLGANVVGGA
jgi:hypothetical protein